MVDRKLNIRGRGEFIEQRELLKDNTHSWTLGFRRSPADRSRPANRFALLGKQACEDPKQHAFACATAADHDGNFGLGKGRINVFQKATVPGNHVKPRQA